jgi:hypothetical protein
MSDCPRDEIVRGYNELEETTNGRIGLLPSRSGNCYYVHYRMDNYFAKPTFVVSSNSLYLCRAGNGMKSVRTQSALHSAEIPFGASCGGRYWTDRIHRTRQVRGLDEALKLIVAVLARNPVW